MAELLGQHRYQLDPKGRIALPTRFREGLAEGAYVTLGQDGCLYAFPAEEWRRQTEAARARPLSGRAARDYNRMFFGYAEQVKLDSQGRLLVPQRLRSHIGLEREAVVLGVDDHIEIWPAHLWDRYQQDVSGAYSSGLLDPDRA